MEKLSPNGSGDTMYYNRKPIFDVQKIDRAAFAVAALLFVLFNVVYWFTFLICNFN